MKPTDKLILSLAVPSIVQNITVPLLGLVDLSIVGHLGSATAIAAIAVGTTIFNVLYWLVGFLRMGTSGLTSQAFGRGSMANVELLLKRSLLLGWGIAATLLVLQVPVCRLALLVIAPSQAVAPLASLYFYICVWGAPAVLGLYALNGWFVGLQDTRTPLYVAIAQNIINICASLSFVYVFGWGLAGVALGTLVAQWSGFLISISVAVRRIRRFRQEANEAETAPRLRWADFFSVNRDIFFRTLFLVGVNLFFTSAGARQGDTVLSANTVLFTFSTLFSYIMDGFAFAAEALCGNFHGSGDAEGVRRVVRRLFVWGWGMAVVFTLAYALGGRWLVSLLTTSQPVLQLVPTYFPWVLLLPACGVAAYVYDGVFIGVTATKGMLVSSLLASAAFFAVFFAGVAVGGPVNHVLWFSFLLFLALRGVMQRIWVVRKNIY